MTARVSSSQVYNYFRFFNTRAPVSASTVRSRACRVDTASDDASPRETLPLQEELIEELFMATQAIADASSADEASDIALRLIQQHIPCESAAVISAGNNDTKLRFLAASGPSAAEVSGLTLPMDAGFAGQSFQGGHDFIVRDAAGDERHLDSVDAETGYQTHEMLVASLRIDHMPVGCIELINPARPFTREDLEIVRTVARPLAAFLDSQSLS